MGPYHNPNRLIRPHIPNRHGPRGLSPNIPSILRIDGSLDRPLQMACSSPNSRRRRRHRGLFPRTCTWWAPIRT